MRPGSMPPHENGAQKGPPEAAASDPPTARARRRRAWRDVVRGAQASSLWLRPELDRTRRKLQRTVVGPFVPVLNRALMIAVMGPLVGKFMGADLMVYLPHVAVGIVVWLFMRGLLLDGCAPFAPRRKANAAPAGTRPPVSVRVYRNVWRALIGFGMNAVLIVVALAFLGVRPGWAALAALPGLALLCLNGLWAGVLLGSIAPNSKRLKSILRQVLRFAFLATPVLWMADAIPDYAALVRLNPFYHLVEVVRGPLLGDPPSAASWLCAATITALGSAFALAAFGRHLESTAART